MKAFSIMAVVFNHTHIKPEIQQAVYLVCLPAFFFLAGLFTNTQLSIKAFYEKKTLRLLIPYIIWGILAWIFWFFVTSRYGCDDDKELAWWQPLVGMLYGRRSELSHNGPLWFLCCMISLEWIYYIITRVTLQWVRWIIIVCLGVFGCILSYLGQNWIWGISAAFIVLPIYAIGAEYRNSFILNIKSFKTPTLVIMLLCSLIGLSLSYIFNADIGLSESYIGNPFFYYLTACSAIALWLVIALMIEKHIHFPMRLLQYIGQNTLLILCTHILTFSITKSITLIFPIPLSFFDTTIGCIILWLNSFVILLPISYFINRYCPILLGKRRTNP